MIHHVHETRRLLKSLESDKRKEGVTRIYQVAMIKKDSLDDRSQ